MTEYLITDLLNDKTYKKNLKRYLEIPVFNKPLI